jgi:predicted Zn-dependent protease
MSQDWTAALEGARAAMALQATCPLAIWLGAVRASQALGRHDEALRYLDAMLAQDPGHAVALDARGTTLAALGRGPEALEAFRAALRADPAFTLPAVHLARALGDPGEARAVLEETLGRHPRDEALWTVLLGLSARHEPGRLLADTLAALRALPDGGQGHWHHLVARALLDRGEVAGAARVLDLGLAAFPGHGGLGALRASLGYA